MNLSEKLRWLTELAPAEPQDAPEPARPRPAPTPARALPRPIPAPQGSLLAMFACPGMHASIVEATCVSTRAGGKVAACSTCHVRPT